MLCIFATWQWEGVDGDWSHVQSVFGLISLKTQSYLGYLGYLG